MQKQKSKPLILITNDDGINANGLNLLIDIARPLGNILVIAPEKAQSGQSHAVTLREPLFIKKIKQEEGLEIYVCSGTPADCVKFGVNQLSYKKPDFLFSGINHGSNSSINIVYSGTMAAAIEGCLNGIQSVGLSFDNHSPEAPLTTAKHFAFNFLNEFINNPLPEGICLNVNFPDTEIKNVKGFFICKQAKGVWNQELQKRVHPIGKEYYWLTGNFEHFDKNADNDVWALQNGYIPVVPIRIDFTSFETIELLNKWNLQINDNQ